CFKSILGTTPRETRSNRLLLNQLSAPKFFDRRSVIGHVKKSIVLFGCRPCQRLKPVCIVCYAFTNRPLFHSGRNVVGNSSWNFCTVKHSVFYSGVGFFGQILTHRVFIKNVLSKNR